MERSAQPKKSGNYCGGNDAFVNVVRYPGGPQGVLISVKMVLWWALFYKMMDLVKLHCSFCNPRKCNSNSQPDIFIESEL